MGRENKTAASYGRDPFADLDDFPVVAQPTDHSTPGPDSVEPVPTNGDGGNGQSGSEETAFDFPWSAGEETAPTPPPVPAKKRTRKRRKPASAPSDRPVDSTELAEPPATTVKEPVPPAPQRDPAPLPVAESPASPAATPQDSADILSDLIASDDQEAQTFDTGAATELPASAQADAGAGGREQYILFGLAGTEYATLLTNVMEIGRPSVLTPVPNVPEWVLGVTNLRGDIVSIVDLRRLLQVGDGAMPPDPRLLLAHTQHQDLTAGLVVDRVKGVRFLPADQIKPPAAPMEGPVASYLRGVLEYEGHLLVILDLDRLLLSSEMRQFEPV